MKNLITSFTTVLVVCTISSCNVFDWTDPNIDTLDRCRSSNDAGDFSAAIEQCTAVITDDPTNMDAQLELADASLGAIGVSLKSLSDVFLNKATSKETVLALAEHMIAQGLINKDSAILSKAYAQSAITGMQSYGALLIGSSNASNLAENTQVAAFYELLARLCRISLLMAYADLDAIAPNVPNGKVDAADICNPAQTGCAKGDANICIGTACEGMNSDDAGTVLEDFKRMASLLTTLPTNLNTGTVKDMTVEMVSIGGSSYPINAIPSGFEDDAGRNLLLQMTR